ncbi:hypothetical protein IKF34_01010 [Candidatus Saccharibacteria bacterium]|nr:hypothetical protein [Candidatus Saccharibacteria bacterium]
MTTTEYVLTSEACTTSGTNLNKTNSSGSIQSGKTARVGKPSGVSNDYVFQGWVNNATDCIDASGKSYNTFTSASGMPEYVDGADFVVKSLKQNRVVYAMYEELEEEKYVNLKVYAVDDEGRYIGQSGSIVNNSSGADITGWFGSGNPITIPDMEQKSLSLIVGSIRSDNAEGMKYKFVGWAPYMPYPKSNTLDLAKRSCGSIINGELCTYEFYAMHEIDGDNANIYAVYKKNSVSGSTNAVRSDDGTMITNMPLVDTNTDRRKAQNCEPECEVKFVHRLKNEGNISTRWRVTRYSNYWDGTYGAYITSGNIEEGYLNGTAEKDVRTSGVYKLKPGMVVCETMHFKSLENLNDPETTTTACISAEGTVYAGLNILVSRNSGEYGKSVYAKPGDRLRYKVDYNSAPQYAYGLRPDRLGNIGSIKINEDNNSGASLGKTIIGAPSLFDTYKDKVPDLKSWNNAFYIWSSSDGLLHDRLKIDPGDILGKHLEYTGVDGIGYLVEDSYVGKALTTSAYTNVVDQSDINTTPNSVSFKDIDNKNTANVGVDRIGSEVKVIVPYNFTMTTEVLGKSSNIVYAGEEDGNIKYSVKVNKRTNGLVGSDDPYATKVPGAKAKLKVTNCEDDVYGVSNEVELGTLGKDYSKDVAGIVINIPDILAGSRICVYSMVWPGNSGPEDNIDTGNFGDWVVSEPKEFKVAKKPSFQVWGGGLFVNGNAKLPFAKKKYLEMEGYEVVSGEGK